MIFGRDGFQSMVLDASECINMYVELIYGPKLTQLFLINPGCLCFEESSLFVKIRYNQTMKDKLFMN